MATDKPATYKRIEAVGLSIEILRLLADQRSPISGSDIAKAVGKPYGTVMCHLETLKQDGFAEQVGDSYALGMAAAMLWSRKRAALSGTINIAQAQLTELGGE